MAGFAKPCYESGVPQQDPDFFDPAEVHEYLTRREIFARQDYAAVPPSALDDRQLAGRLWELTYAAAARRFFFCSTNHLSDRELYTLLYEQWLDEPTADIPLETETNTTTIVAEFDARGLSPEEIYLRYYADDGDRDLWRSTDPNVENHHGFPDPVERGGFRPTSIGLRNSSFPKRPAIWISHTPPQILIP